MLRRSPWLPPAAFRKDLKADKDLVFLPQAHADKRGQLKRAKMEAGMHNRGNYAALNFLTGDSAWT